MKKIKKIGIIGGVGPQATQFIYKKIIHYAQNKYKAKNNNDYPYLLIESLPIPDFISNTHKIPQALNMLKNTIDNFNKLKVDGIAIGSNTVHILLDELKQETSIPFLSTIDLVVKKCQKDKFQKVGVLASPILIKNSLYKKSLNKAGIETLLPNEKELQIIENMIRCVLAGKEDEDNKTTYIEIINKMLINKAESIILGCTELPLAINYEALGKRTINPDEVLAEGIVDYYHQ